MALPKAYFTSTKNVDAILAAIQAAQAPPRFTQKFLEGLGFPGVADRLFINVLKSIGFLTDTGVPAPRYHEYLDQTQSRRVLALGIKDAYADLYQINVKAHDMPVVDVKNKMKTLSQGQYGDSVLSKMAATFKVLVKNADFTGLPELAKTELTATDASKVDDEPTGPPAKDRGALRIGGLVYTINIQLPESRDQAVYDALFRSLREHLL
jgi:hypothetical protein